ncbi:MAG: 3'(2'),5'-bisphosphate nucleotidase CysQ [Alphaproteobacteria bacterium]|nr:3'(2'),5'-bisphosphate nucleotidase CysQ [Alphaproteobacteria bacterium]
MVISNETHAALLAQLVEIAAEAGALIMDHYAAGTDHRQKADKSPVTIADEEAEKLIIARLNAVAPGVPVVAEESAAAGLLPDIDGGVFFLVDPLDGTKEFISRNGEFTVNIALIEHGRPVAGVVFAPAIDRMFWGTGTQAFERRGKTGQAAPAVKRIETRRPPDEGMTAIASRSHRDRFTEEFLALYPISNLVTAGSSLKFCVIAAGEADIYPRHGTTMEWDTAAGHAVLLAAGGAVTRLDGKTPLTYGNAAEKFTNPSFVAWGRPR